MYINMQIRMIEQAIEQAKNQLTPLPHFPQHGLEIKTLNTLTNLRTKNIPSSPIHGRRITSFLISGGSAIALDAFACQSLRASRQACYKSAELLH